MEIESVNLKESTENFLKNLFISFFMNMLHKLTSYYYVNIHLHF